MSLFSEKSLTLSRQLGTSVARQLAPLGICILIAACGSAPQTQMGAASPAAASPSTPSSPSSSSSASPAPAPSPSPAPAPSPSPAAASTPSPVAYLYVSGTPKNSSTNQISAFGVAADGSLTPVTGSPFAEDVTGLAASGNTLYAENSDGFDLESYAIQADGSLQFGAKTNASQTGNCNTLGPLFMDHSGTGLYALEYRGSGCANNTYESFAIKGAGQLADLGNSSANNWLTVPASFLANDTYAYTASCVNGMYGAIYGFARGANGSLTQLSINAAPPTPPSGSFYCPTLAATDGANHVAIAMQPIDQQSFSAGASAQIATYTAAANGDLTTSSTAANMPSAQVGTVTDLKMSPSGTLLAVAGSNGLQVFHFNGSSPATPDATLLASAKIDECFWDNENHLYAISQSAGKLYVFTVTDSADNQAPGSPYAINSPQSLAVVAAQ